jgi:catechol 2,3-dioxygenase-like lactoylglutathione lyase family enzyme
MKVLRLTWGGTLTDKFEETTRFFQHVMGLELDEQGPGFASFRTTGGDKFEVFGPEDPDHGFMSTGPVIGFGVYDVDGARSEMEEAGVEFIGATHSEGDYRWAHFYGPDGNVYEISSA